ncbi:MAG: MaoC/PaaZ C-terminal domain-containing protein [Candidatus Hydrogenedentes bacterium]|nr:MaoC/PaaZ C-terminal domain-containing protein [Candidatus Hydrogenedentota bacterium]
MEITSKYVGRKSKPFRITISERDAMNYCAGCYVNNPIFYDDSEKLLVFPLYVVSLTWKISSSFGEFWDTSDFPLDVLATQVHYFEDLRWYRKIYAGETIIIDGEVSAILPHIAGTLLCINYTGTSDNGETLFRELTCSLLRGVKCEDKGAGKDYLSMVTFNTKDLDISRVPIWESTINVNIYDLNVYDGCSNIHFPIHTSQKFAVGVGLPSPIYQGTAILGRILQKFLERVDFSPENKTVESLYARFSSYVLPNTLLKLSVFETGLDSDMDKLYLFTVKDTNDNKVIKDGKILFKEIDLLKEVSHHEK